MHIKSHGHDQHATSKRPANFLVCPIARVELRGNQCNQRMHGAQSQLYFALPLQTWFDCLVRDESGNAKLFKFVFQLGNTSFVFGKVAQEEAETSVGPESAHLDI